MDAILVISARGVTEPAPPPYHLGLGWCIQKFDDDLVRRILARHFPVGLKSSHPADFLLEGVDYHYAIAFCHLGDPVNSAHDAQRSLAEVLDLSRLVHDNALWPQLAVRLMFSPVGRTVITPISMHDRVYSRVTAKQWFTPEEADEVGRLIAFYEANFGDRPERVERAREAFNYACRQSYSDWRHLGMVVALETLLSTSEDRPSKQFTHRLCTLAESVEVPMSSRLAHRIYAARSSLAHGSHPKVESEDSGDPLFHLHVTTERVLRRAIVRAMTNHDFGDQFRTDASVDAFFGPVPPRQCGHCHSTSGLVCAHCGGAP